MLLRVCRVVWSVVDLLSFSSVHIWRIFHVYFVNFHAEISIDWAINLIKMYVCAINCRLAITIKTIHESTCVVTCKLWGRELINDTQSWWMSEFCGWSLRNTNLRKKLIISSHSNFKGKKHVNLLWLDVCSSEQMPSKQFYKSLLTRSHNFTWHTNFLIQIDFLQRNIVKWGRKRSEH